ncbi:MAG: RNA polymerase sigma factor [Candidatus Cloacimonetes bacterium]|jgi:RNA polymerase sigma-70 factor, ECF subfamily|nr:RNA polymerase sigma factor [Candidatus Cloacimonadota bacterium]MBT6994176.1 RNA polymerase sigma factor [Candidatus Cloacimonadota bacterium]MBT7469735.1 RNA polymerase sigma factor [Candidatus Cloacimonadota bacterium]
MQAKKIFEKKVIVLIPRLKSFIKTLIFDEDAANDILQETLITAFTKIIELQEPFNVSGWLFTIAKNKSLNFIKKQKRTIRLAEIPERYFSVFNDNNIESDVAEQQLIDCLSKMSHSSKYILQMKYFTHHSIKEISKLLQMPEGTVKRRLFEARRKLKKEIIMNKNEKWDTKKNAPIIKIIPKKESNVNSVKKLGYGLNFGAPLAGIGDVEIYESYEYPGRILINKFKSEVARKTKIFGKEVIEVVDKSVNQNTKVSKYFYYTIDDDKVSIIFRIMNFSQKLKIDFETDELMEPTCINLKVGEYVNPKINGKSTVDVVDLKIGNKQYTNVLRERESCDDYHGRCYGESFYTSDGREILQRNYISKDWKMGGFVTWEKWKDAPEVEFKGEQFRLWFEFILTENYKIDNTL